MTRRFSQANQGKLCFFVYCAVFYIQEGAQAVLGIAKMPKAL